MASGVTSAIVIAQAIAEVSFQFLGARDCSNFVFFSNYSISESMANILRIPIAGCFDNDEDSIYDSDTPGDDGSLSELLR